MALENVVITQDANKALSKALDQLNYSQLAVLVDENTHELCYTKIKTALPEHILIQIKSGEIHKSLETCWSIWSVFTEQALDRRGLLINLGGGVIGDMGGFCARTYKRGISFINIPTTLLSQVDASIGGKLGIDFEGYKNHIGLFSDPDLVIIDPIFLETLPENELKSGYAEVIKHNLIADKQNWLRISKKPFSQMDWLATIEHSVNVKKRVVEEDPKESGKRKILNFGHTLGHAIESHLLNSNRPVLHGEAVAAGMIAESYLSWQKGYISESDHKSIAEYIESLYEKIKLEESDIKSIRKYAVQDKKNKGNKVLAALLEDIGSANWDVELTSEEIELGLRYYATYT